MALRLASLSDQKHQEQKQSRFTEKKDHGGGPRPQAVQTPLVAVVAIWELSVPNLLFQPLVRLGVSVPGSLCLFKFVPLLYQLSSFASFLV